MITLQRCKEILNKGKRKYNNDEIKEIVNYLYLIGQIESD